MRKTIVIVLSIIICIVSVGAERGEKIPYDNSIDFEANGFEEMYATAYYQGEVTAMGVPVHSGICACNPHLGEVAIVYTLSGNYLGMYYCCDTGSTEGLKSGKVIDIWKKNYTHCKGFMKMVGKYGGKVYVKWVKGVG